MHWDIYTGAAVGSGAVLILFAVFGGNTTAKRLLGLVAGFAFMAYGIYVANQTSGTYYFPVVMFLIPLFGIAHFGKALLARSRGSVQPQTTRGAARQAAPAPMLETWRGNQG